MNKVLNQVQESAIKTLVAKYMQPGPGVFEKLATKIPLVGTDKYDLSFLGRMPAMREMLGEVQSHRLTAEQITGNTKRYEATIELDRNDVEYNRFGVANFQARMMGDSVVDVVNELCVDVIDAGSTVTGFDAVSLFNDSHPDGIGGTYDNNLAGSGYASIGQFATDWAAAKAAMRAFKVKPAGPGDSRPLNLVPNAVLTPPAHEAYFKQLFTAERYMCAGVETTNLYKGDAPVENVIVRADLSDDDDWYAFYVDPRPDSLRPLLVFQNREPEVEIDESLMFSKQVIRVGVKCELKVTVGAPWLIIRTVNS